MRARRRRLALAARKAASQAVCRKLADLPVDVSVAVYLAGPDEIDLGDFIADSLRRGRRLFAPRWNGVGYELAELGAKGGELDLRSGPHGIMEPRNGSSEAASTAHAVQVWLVPGLAFARDGVRLGYGGGWYDRMLVSANADARILGIAYSFQIVDSLPTEPHDVKMTGVIDET